MLVVLDAVVLDLDVVRQVVLLKCAPDVQLVGSISVRISEGCQLGH